MPNRWSILARNALSSCVRCGLEGELRIPSPVSLRLNGCLVRLDPRAGCLCNRPLPFLFFLIFSTTVALLSIPNPLCLALCAYSVGFVSLNPKLTQHDKTSCSTPYRNDMSGARGCFNCGGCALLFLCRLLLSLARSRFLFLESASDTGSNSLAAFCCHSLAPSSLAIRRTSFALVYRMRLFSRFCEIYPVPPSPCPPVPRHHPRNDCLTFFLMI